MIKFIIILLSILLILLVLSIVDTEPAYINTYNSIAIDNTANLPTIKKWKLSKKRLTKKEYKWIKYSDIKLN